MASLLVDFPTPLAGGSWSVVIRSGAERVRLRGTRSDIFAFQRYIAARVRPATRRMRLRA